MAGNYEIIFIEYLGCGTFKATLHKGDECTLVGEGTKDEVQREIVKLTNRFSKTYNFQVCLEWDNQ